MYPVADADALFQPVPRAAGHPGPGAAHVPLAIHDAPRVVALAHAEPLVLGRRGADVDDWGGHISRPQLPTLTSALSVLMKGSEQSDLAMKSPATSASASPYYASASGTAFAANPPPPSLWGNSSTPGYAYGTMDGRSVVSIVVWDDPNIVWSSFDVVVARSVWNVHKHLRTFKEWANSVSKVACLYNPLEAIEWSLDRFQCMKDLSQRGITCAPMFFLPQESVAHQPYQHFPHTHNKMEPQIPPMPEISLDSQSSYSVNHASDSLHIYGLLRDRGWTSSVVKPAVGSAPLTGDCAPIFVSLAGQNLVNYSTKSTSSDYVQHRVSLMQRACESGQIVIHRGLTHYDQGELCFIFFNGMFSHCIRHVARSSSASALAHHTSHSSHHGHVQACEYNTQGEHGASYSHHIPTDDELFFAVTVQKATLSILNDKQIGKCACGSIGCAYLCTCGFVEQSPPNDIVPYMRIDVIRDDDSNLALLGVEMVDPELFLRSSTSAALAFADTIISIASNYRQRQFTQQFSQQQPLSPALSPETGQSGNFPPKRSPIPADDISSFSDGRFNDSDSALSKFSLTPPVHPSPADTGPLALPDPPVINLPTTTHHPRSGITWPANPLRRSLIGVWGQGL
ncbi:hypothetical protein Pelo_16177 [Pelomyxa schiedti]|nr:hypothetical protein Pelo_16177 [Pelomyxa schiedti]